MIVLDCSAGIEMAKNSELGNEFFLTIEKDELVVAPSLYATEVANVAWKYVHTGMLSRQEAQQLADDALAIVDRFVPVEGLAKEALATGIFLDHSVYDMMYFVLARRECATLLTADKRLQELCVQQGVVCVQEIAF